MRRPIALTARTSVAPGFLETLLHLHGPFSSILNLHHPLPLHSEWLCFLFHWRNRNHQKRTFIFPWPNLLACFACCLSVCSFLSPPELTVFFSLSSGLFQSGYKHALMWSIKFFSTLSIAPSLPLPPPAPFLEAVPSHRVKPPGEDIYYLLAASVPLLLISSSTTAISLLTMRLLNSPQ